MDDSVQEPIEESRKDKNPEILDKVVGNIKKKFASAEVSVSRASNALQQMSKMFKQAYKRGALSGGDVYRREAEALSLSADLAQIQTRIIAFHELLIEDAKKAGVDQPGPYAGLGPVDPDVLMDKSGGGR